MAEQCGWCGSPTSTKCSGCQKEWCKDLREGIATAELLISSLNPPPNRQDAFGVIQSSQEMAAQDICWNASEIQNNWPEKIDMVLQALKTFPLSIEAWGMLGAFYRYDLPKSRRNYDQSVRMYENAIRSARKLNPSWSDDRTEPLEWGHVETRPYIRALQGRAMALKEAGRIEEAIVEAKKLIKWHENNPICQLLCNWCLEAGNTQDFLQLYADIDEDRRDAPLAYSYVLYQILRWENGEVVEKAIEKALCSALKENQFIPDLLLQEETIQEIKMQYLDSGGPKEAHQYAVDAQSIWRAHPGALRWLAAKKNSDGNPVPATLDLIQILRSKIDVRVKCEHTALNGSDRKTSFVYANQRRDTSVGCALPEFYWPNELEDEYSPGSPILLYRNDLFDDDRPQNLRLCWRKTTEEKILEVPFWKVLCEGIFEGWIES